MNYIRTLDKIQVNTIDDLKQYPNWVFWRIEIINDQVRKVPYTIYNKKARTNDPQTWTSFDIVSMVYEKDPEKYDGIGFVFSEHDPFVFIDLDKCIDKETGVINESKSGIVDNFSKGGALVERSQSGTGIHIITKGKLYGGVNRHEQGIEIYSEKRFVALTFDLTDQSTTINYTQKLIDELVQEYKPAQKTHSSMITTDLSNGQTFNLSHKVWDAFDAINNSSHGKPVVINDTVYNTRSEAEGYIIMHLKAHGYKFNDCLNLFKKYNKGSFADEPVNKQYSYLKTYWENATRVFNDDRIRIQVTEIIKTIPNIRFEHKRSDGSMRRVLQAILNVAYLFRTMSPMVSTRDIQIATGISNKAVRNNISKLADEGYILLDQSTRTNVYHLTNKLTNQGNVLRPCPPTDKEYAYLTLREIWLFKYLGGSTQQIYEILDIPMTVNQLSDVLERHPQTIRTNLNLLKSVGIVTKGSKNLWKRVENIDWDSIDEEFNVSLQIGATKEFIKQERESYTEEYKEWKQQQKGEENK